jgi:hypothetical protein
MRALTRHARISRGSLPSCRPHTKTIQRNGLCARPSYAFDMRCCKLTRQVEPEKAWLELANDFETLRSIEDFLLDSAKAKRVSLLIGSE